MSEPNRSEETLFETLSQLPASDRAEYLETACGADAALRVRLETLLAAHDRAGGFMAEPALPAGAQRSSLAIPVAERLGDQIGAYKLLQRIGEGGCGVVYMAQQDRPVRRLVALKVIKLGMDTRQVVARFEAERQALALMDHPHIAKVLDAGATQAGRPYFVMELVRGLKITDYCDQNRLAPRQRLELFIQVCRAVQHAHQKGIIHRDLKPSNVLVAVDDGFPVPKVIDFGIAKATQGRLTDKTLVTAFEQFIGTPAYVSPEQALMSNVDIDTRSDIYSLGVLLYELLTGKTPFDTQSLLAAGLDELRRTICEKAPAPPSTRLHAMEEADLTTVARARQTEPPKLIHTVRGDLDWIVMRCLAKDRNRRYETATGLARDIERHLNHEPVTARPPSRIYEFQKTARRHWVGFVAAAAVIAALTIGMLAGLLEAARARRAEALATQRLRESEAVSRFLSDVFQRPDPTKDGRTITVAEALRMAAKKQEADLADQPEARARLQNTLAWTYHALGLSHDAIPLEEQVWSYYLATRGRENVATLEAMHRLAIFYDDTGRHAESLRLREQEVPLRLKVSGSKDSDTLWAMGDLATSYSELGRLSESLKLRQEVLDLSVKARGPEDPGTLIAMNDLARSFEEMGRLKEAIELQERVLVLQRKVVGPEHPYALVAMNNLANSYDDAGRTNEALKLREQVLELELKVSGAEHPDTLMALSNLANSYDKTGRTNEALKLREQVLELRRKVNGPEHLFTLYAIYNLADSYEEVGRRNEALILREQLLELSRKALGAEHPFTLESMIAAADAYEEAGRLAEAAKLQDQVLALRSKVLGPQHPDTLEILNTVARRQATCTMAEWRNGTNAVALAEVLVAATHRTNAAYLDTLAAAYAETRQFDKAEDIERAAIDRLQSGHEKEADLSRLHLYETRTPYRANAHLERGT